MAYIGKNPTVGNFQKCDAISVVNGQAAYTLQVDSVNVSPESPNHCLVSLNGILQAPSDSYTISGSTLTFASNLATGDVIDFVIILGNVLDLGVPSDATVTKAKTNFVSSGSGYTGTGLDIKGNGSANGRLGLLCSAGSHGVALESPDHSSAQSYTIQLPSNSPTVDKFIKVTSLTGSGATAIAHTQFADAGGNTVLLGESNITSATAAVTFDGLFTSDYSNYKIIMTDLLGSAPAQMRMRVLISGSENTSSNYYSAHISVQGSSGGGSADASREWGDSSWELLNASISNNSAEVSNFYVDLPNPLLASSKPTMASQHAVNVSNSSQFHAGVGGYFYNTATAISGVKIFQESGNITQGNFYLYGIKG
tara:strand:+ start:239 stop:1339 length:1101 start_codon:yes stop_codon:yes gene_type:complete